MGLYFRKSARFGPVRFNFSRSGVGASIGVPGFRIGIDANGNNYVHAGRGGIYYRENLGRPTDAPKHRPLVVGGATATHGPMIEHGSSHRGVNCDELTAALMQAAAHTSFTLLAALFLLAALTFLAFALANGHADLATLGLVSLALTAVAGGLLAVMTCWQKDQAIKVRVKYELGPSAAERWDAFCDLISALPVSVKVIRAGAEVYNPKYHSGAGRIVDAVPIRTHSHHRLRGLECDLTAPAIEPVRGTIYTFLPDRIVCVRDGRLSRISYREIEFETGNTTLIEDYAPRGATIVGYSWKYTNKDGGPDRRFKNNYQTPIVRYSYLRILTNDGMDHALLFVHESVATALVQGLKALASWLANYSRVVPEIPTRPAEVKGHLPPAQNEIVKSLPAPPPRKVTISREELFDAVLDAMCCVMFADGVVSPSERKVASRLLLRLKAPWNEKEITARMKARWDVAEEQGLPAVLAVAEGRLRVIKSGRQQSMLKTCLREIAKSDETIDSKEMTVFERLLKALPPTEN